MRNKTRIIDNMNKNGILIAVPAKPSKLTKSRTDWANNLSEELRAALEKSLIEANKGKIISHLDAMKQIKIKYNL